MTWLATGWKLIIWRWQTPRSHPNFRIKNSHFHKFFSSKEKIDTFLHKRLNNKKKRIHHTQSWSRKAPISKSEYIFQWCLKRKHIESVYCINEKGARISFNFVVFETSCLFFKILLFLLQIYDREKILWRSPRNIVVCHVHAGVR